MTPHAALPMVALMQQPPGQPAPPVPPSTPGGLRGFSSPPPEPPKLPSKGSVWMGLLLGAGVVAAFAFWLFVDGPTGASVAFIGLAILGVHVAAAFTGRTKWIAGFWIAIVLGILLFIATCFAFVLSAWN